MNPGLMLLVNALNIYKIILIIRILLSWFPNVDRRQPVVQLLFRVTDPVLEPVRRAIPPLGGIDISPIIVFLAIHFAQGILTRAAM